MRDQDIFLEKALIEDGLLDSQKLADAKKFGAENNLDLVDALVKSQTLSGRDIALTKADLCETPYVELSDYEPAYTNTQLIPRALAERFCAFPLFMIDGVLTLAMDNPLNLDATDQVRQIVKCEVDPVQCERQALRELITRAYSLSHGQQSSKAETRETITDSADASEPVVAAVNQLLADAISL